MALAAKHRPYGPLVKKFCSSSLDSDLVGLNPAQVNIRNLTRTFIALNLFHLTDFKAQLCIEIE